MPLSSASIRRFVGRALVDATGTPLPDRAQLVGAFGVLCGSFRGRLQPLFGTAAVDALFARAVHLATAEFAWLAGVPNPKDPCDIDRMAGLNDFDVGVLQEGFAAVLAHNIELLATFVGEDLVLPLVQQAWGTVTVADAIGTEDDQ